MYTQKQIEDLADFPNEIIKKPNLQDFEMLSYDSVPNYDPSEGIKYTITNFHPKDHPSYPHYCYPVYSVRYAKWLKNTAVFEVEDKMIPVHDNIKPEVCVCVHPQTGQCRVPDCNFTEDNPVCPIRPRCIGCNYMFKYDVIHKHLKDHPSCYSEYTSMDYVDLENLCNKLLAAQLGLVICKGCKDKFRLTPTPIYWKKPYEDTTSIWIQDHLTETPTCHDVYSPEEHTDLRTKCVDEQQDQKAKIAKANTR